MFFVYIMPEKLEKATITCHRGLFSFRKTRAEESHGYRAVIAPKSPVLRGLSRVQMFFSNIFPYTSVALLKVM